MGFGDTHTEGERSGRWERHRESERGEQKENMRWVGIGESQGGQRPRRERRRRRQGNKDWAMEFKSSTLVDPFLKIITIKKREIKSQQTTVVFTVQQTKE
ncbi:unnamed protein product [Gadus morhua 'NCC']